MHQQTPQTNSKQSCNLKKPKLKGSLQIRDRFLKRFNTQSMPQNIPQDWLGSFREFLATIGQSKNSLISENNP